jgi:hypothetical protein
MFISRMTRITGNKTVNRLNGSENVILPMSGKALATGVLVEEPAG